MEIMTEEKVNNSATAVQIPRVSRGYLVGKWCFDRISSLLASILLLVPMAVLALVVVIMDPGAPIYVQTRVGKDGKPLRQWSCSPEGTLPRNQLSRHSL